MVPSGLGLEVTLGTDHQTIESVGAEIANVKLVSATLR